MKKKSPNVASKRGLFTLYFFSSAKFSKVVVSGPNHLLSSIAEVLNALILLSEPRGDHTWIVVLTTVELWARMQFSHLSECRCKYKYLCWCGYTEHAGKSVSDSR